MKVFVVLLQTVTQRLTGGLSDLLPDEKNQHERAEKCTAFMSRHHRRTVYILWL